MLNLPELDGILDLWGAAWGPEERRALEGALLRSLADATQPRSVRRAALAACHVFDTPRLKQALVTAWRSGKLSIKELLDIERAALPLRQLMQEAELLRGNLGALEALCRAAPAHVPSLDALLDLVDVRDLIALSVRRPVDPMARREVTRRLLRRGPHQRRRLRAIFEVAREPSDDESTGGRSADDEPYAEYALELH